MGWMMRLRLVRTIVKAIAVCATVMSAAAQAPSARVQPALDKLAAAGSSVDLNKWKGGNALRGEADAHLASIQKDLQTTLPPLLVASDRNPDSISAGLPVLLNLDALYSVVLRVDLLAKANAPRDQAEALDGALTVLDGARRDLGALLLDSAAANEKQMVQMRAAAQQQAAQIAAAQQVAPVPPPVAPVKPKPKKRVVKQTAPAVPAPSK